MRRESKQTNKKKINHRKEKKKGGRIKDCRSTKNKQQRAELSLCLSVMTLNAIKLNSYRRTRDWHNAYKK